MSAARTPRLVRTAPYLLVPEVAASGAHYQDILGIRREYVAGDPPEFAIYARDGLPVMLRRAPDPSVRDLDGHVLGFGEPTA